jgi:hypothetical protein
MGKGFLFYSIEGYSMGLFHVSGQNARLAYWERGLWYMDAAAHQFEMHPYSMNGTFPATGLDELRVTTRML